MLSMLFLGKQPFWISSCHFAKKKWGFLKIASVQLFRFSLNGTHLVCNELGPPTTDASRALEGLAVKSKEDSEDAMPKVPLEEQLHNVHPGVRGRSFTWTSIALTWHRVLCTLFPGLQFCWGSWSRPGRHLYLKSLLVPVLVGL